MINHRMRLLLSVQQRGERCRQQQELRGGLCGAVVERLGPSAVGGGASADGHYIDQR